MILPMKEWWGSSSENYATGWDGIWIGGQLVKKREKKSNIYIYVYENDFVIIKVVVGLLEEGMHG